MTTFSDKEKTRAFAQKMREEGAAGFAAGPWMSWEENGNLEQAIIEGQIIPGDKHKHTGTHHHRKITGDRFLTWVASIALIAMLVGIAGVYLTTSKHEVPAQITNGVNPTASFKENSNNSWQADKKTQVITPEKTAHEKTQTPVGTPVEPVKADNIAPEISAAEKTPAISPVETMTTKPATPEPVFDTEPEATRSAAPEKSAGAWQVNIESYFVAGRASRRLAELRNLGINAEQSITEVNGKTVYRLGIPGFASLKAAQTHADLLKQQHNLNSIWINKR